jgi:hypothetical protein
MLNLLNPLGLLALAALAVPAAIHLWRRPRRTVRLGSLKFLEAVARPRLSQWRWRDRWLLLLRLALVALLALVLARPEWLRPPTQPVRRALVAPETALAAAASTEWAALRKEDYEMRTLKGDDVWSELREAEARVAKGSAFVVFAPRRLATLRGERPAFAHATVRWIDPTGGKSERWLESVARDAGGKRWHVTVGMSEAGGTRFECMTVPAGAKTVVAGGATLPLPAAVGAEPALRVAIFHAEDRVEDARTVAAAARAAAAVSGRAITVALNPPGPVEADWAVALGTTRPGAVELRAAVELGLRVVSDGGVGEVTERAATFAWAEGAEVALRRRGAAGAGVVQARDSFGEPVWTEERIGRGRWWHFASRFQPEWSGAAQGTALAAWLRERFGETDGGALERGRDRRNVSGDQVGPAVAREAAARAVIPEKTDLTGLSWWLVAALFLTERGLSHWWSRRHATEGGA